MRTLKLVLKRPASRSRSANQSRQTPTEKTHGSLDKPTPITRLVRWFTFELLKIARCYRLVPQFNHCGWYCHTVRGTMSSRSKMLIVNKKDLRRLMSEKKCFSTSGRNENRIESRFAKYPFYVPQSTASSCAANKRTRGNHKRILFAWLSFSDTYSVFVNFVLHFIDK